MTETRTPPVAKRSWRQRRPILTFLRRRWRSWRERHQHSFNFAIHLLGIPLALAGVVLLFFQAWYWGGAALLAGYGLQYLGHAVEGNDVGEWAAIKRLLGLPYIAVAPSRPPKPDPAVPGPGQ